MRLPSDIQGLLERQHGLITRRQAVKLGCPASTFDNWVMAGLLERVQRATYRLRGAPESDLQRLLAAVLRCGSRARAGGDSACALHRLEGFALGATPTVVVPVGARLRPVPFSLCHLDVTRPDRAVVDGIPTLSAACALITVAHEVSERRLRVAVDSARRLRRLDLPQLQRTAARLAQLPGAGVVAELLAAGVLEQDGEGARALAKLLASGGLHPRWEVWVLPNVRVDALFPEAMLVLEYDGRDTHTLPTDREADRRRHKRLDDAGYLVERVRWEDLRDRPLETLGRIAGIRAQRIAKLALR